ncbi:antibiotic biosynthesis monooxygenase [Paenibacillus sp. N1-5-1-14]|nr:antibiotic biosynthesis monooxygenase [Paenibacillus radicibacter]
MVVEIIRYQLAADLAESFVRAYQEAGVYLDRSPHCLAYEITQGVEEPNHYIIRIEWDSVEGHMQGFRQEENFQHFFALVKPYFSSIQEMKHYRIIRT